MFTVFGIDDMRGQCANVAQLTVFDTHQIAVAHQRNSLAVDPRDAMHHIMVAVDPCQYDMAYFESLGLLQDDALLTTDDERQHALSIDWQGDTKTLTDQSAGLFDDDVVFHFTMDL